MYYNCFEMCMRYISVDRIAFVDGFMCLLQFWRLWRCCVAIKRWMYCEPPKTHPLQPNMWKFYYCINHSCCLLMGPSLMVSLIEANTLPMIYFKTITPNGKSTPIKSAWNPRQTILKQFVLFGFGTPFLALSFVEVQINVKIDECCFSSLHRFCFTNLSDFKSRISMQKKASSFRASHIHKISEFIIFNMIFIILKIFVSTVPTICWLQLNVLFIYSFNCRQSKKKKKQNNNSNSKHIIWCECCWKMNTSPIVSNCKCISFEWPPEWNWHPEIYCKRSICQRIFRSELNIPTTPTKANYLLVKADFIESIVSMKRFHWHDRFSKKVQKRDAEITNIYTKAAHSLTTKSIDILSVCFGEKLQLMRRCECFCGGRGYYWHFIFPNVI